MGVQRYAFETKTRVCVCVCVCAQERKLQELTEIGVPDKYRAELEKYRVGASR